MEIRDATERDRHRIRGVLTEAFEDDGAVADLVDELRRSGRMVVERVADDGEGLLGHVALDRCWVDDEQELVEALVLSPLGVVPERQGEGVGTRLVEAALGAARAAGMDLVFLEGAPGYYGTRGFTRASDHGFLRPSERIPDPAFQVVVLADRGVRGRVVYPDAFWVHDATGLRGEVLARVSAELGD